MKKTISEKVLEILNTNIENNVITPEQTEEDLPSLGLDSITFIRVIVALEEAFDIEIPDEKLLITEMNTVSKMASVIAAVMDGKYKDGVTGE